MEVGKFSRVNGAWLKEHVGNQVAMVGKVVESSADTVKLTASVRDYCFTLYVSFFHILMRKCSRYIE
jgi:hypothetical protein